MKESQLKDFGVGFKNAAKVNIGSIVAFAFVFIVSIFVSSRFCTVSNLLSVMRNAATNSICAFAMTFVMITGGIDLSVGSFMSLSGCLCTVLVAWKNFPLPAAILLSLCVGAVYGLINGLIITKLNMPPFIVTLAAMNILRGSSYLMTDGRPVIIDNKVFAEIGGGLWNNIPIPVFYVIVLFIVFWFLLNRTRFGRHVYAVGGNITAAKYSGIKTDKVITITYVLSGLMASFAGIILSSRLNSGQPIIGDGAEMDAIAACVVGGVAMTGGTGTLFGTQVGAFIIAILSNILNLSGINSYAQLVAKGIVILVAVYLYSLRDAKKGIRFMRIKNRKSNENSGI